MRILETSRQSNYRWCKRNAFYLPCISPELTTNLTSTIHPVLEKRQQFETATSARLFAHETSCSHWTDFREILCLSIFRKSVEKIQVSLKSDDNNGDLSPSITAQKS